MSLSTRGSILFMAAATPQSATPVRIQYVLDGHNYVVLHWQHFQSLELRLKRGCREHLLQKSHVCHEDPPSTTSTRPCDTCCSRRRPCGCRGDMDSGRSLLNVTPTSSVRKRVVAIISVRLDTWVKLVPATNVSGKVPAVTGKVGMLTSSRMSVVRRSIHFQRYCLPEFDRRIYCRVRIVHVSIVA